MAQENVEVLREKKEKLNLMRNSRKTMKRIDVFFRQLVLSQGESALKHRKTFAFLQDHGWDFPVIIGKGKPLSSKIDVSHGLD